MQQDRAHWSNRLAFVLAASGSAIGLGNLWKFPYIAGTNGGGAFVLVYLVCIAIIGFPVLIGELFVGQQSQKNVVQSFEVLHRHRTPWRLAGWMGLVSAFLILSFYSVVGGWILDFEVRALLNQFATRSGEEIQTYLDTLFASPVRVLFWHFAFMVLTTAIVANGVKKGIERWVKILMPVLSLILLGLLVYSFFLSGFNQALSFLFSWDTSQLTVDGVLEAMGHAFFTLSLGMGAMLTYGSYLNQDESLPRTALTVAVMDTVIALVSGLVIFSIVFSHGVDPKSGPDLMFKTLPVLFAQIPGGTFIAIAFFLLVAFAALTSAVSLLEVVVAYWEETHNKNRAYTAIICGIAIAILGVFSALSFNLLSGVKIGELTIFGLLDTITSQALLPLGGTLIALFFGWVLGKRAMETVLKTSKEEIFSLFILWSTRAIAPLAILGAIGYKLITS